MWLNKDFFDIVNMYIPLENKTVFSNEIPV